MNKLQVGENQGARIVTGCTKRAPIGALLAEAGMEPLKVRMEAQTAIAYERCIRMDERHPTSAIAKGQSRQRLKSVHSWREQARETLQDIGLEGLARQSAVVEPFKTWERRAEV